MLIQKMHDGASGLLAKIIIALVILAFSFVGFNTFIRLFQQQSDAVAINGETISKSELAQAVNRYKQNVAAHYGPNYLQSLNEEQLNHLVLEQLIEQRVIHQAMKERNFIITDTMVHQAIQNIAAFKGGDGKFDLQLLKKFLAAQGQSFKDFQLAIVNQLQIEQLNNALYDTDFQLNNRVKLFAKIFFEKRDVRSLELDTTALKTLIQPDESEIKQFFEQHASDYVEPEKVKIEYINYQLKQVLAQVNITEQELEQAYQQAEKAESGKAKYKLAHILIKKDTRSLEEAKQLAEKITADLNQGQSFEAMVTQYSEDEATKATKGSLGEISLSDLPSALSQALATMSPEQVTGPVVSEYGVHILKLFSKEESHIKPFAELKTTLLSELRERKAKEIYAQQLEKIADLAFSANNLNEVARTFGLPIEETSWFIKDQPEAAGAIVANKKVVEQAFLEDMRDGLHNSDLIEINSGENIIFRVKAYQEERQKTFDEVKDQVITQVTNIQAQKMAMNIANDLIKEWDLGKDTAESMPFVEQKFKTKPIWKYQPSIERKALLEQQQPDPVLAEAFQLVIKDKKPAYRVIENDKNKMVLIEVSKQQDGDFNQLNEQQKNFIEQYQLVGYTYPVIQSFIAQLKAKARIKNYLLN